MATDLHERRSAAARDRAFRLPLRTFAVMAQVPAKLVARRIEQEYVDLVVRHTRQVRMQAVPLVESACGSLLERTQIGKVVDPYGKIDVFAFVEDLDACPPQTPKARHFFPQRRSD